MCPRAKFAKVAKLEIIFLLLGVLCVLCAIYSESQWRLTAALLHRSCVIVAARQFFHKVHLDLLDLQKLLPLVLDQDV
jgi:hypothetical protein